MSPADAVAPRTVQQRYSAAAHRMQSATAFDVTKRLGIGLMGGHLSPEMVNRAIKDVRVGVNSVMSDAGGLAGLLVKKGVITNEEYLEAVAVSMEREADMVCAQVCERYNLPPGTSFA